MKNIEILDCTLRDGSYVTNFQFSKRDTKNIVSGLDKSGVNFIEVGHGLGLGASSPKFGISYESDYEYINVAKKAAPNRLIGSFCIPGIGSKKDIRESVKAGLDFIRIGVNVDEISEAEEFVKLSHDLGLQVHLNLMKTYAFDPKILATEVRKVKKWPLDVIYVVDSAGSMLPKDTENYVTMLKNNTSFDVGFHGHNNLGIANANCIAAADAGARFVDGTLLGIGRSAGNAQLEVIAWVIEQSGYQTNIDCISLFDVAERWVMPLMPKAQGLMPIDVTIGMSKFHTSFMPRLKRALDKYDVDLKKLIVEVSKKDFINPSQDLINKVAKDLSRSPY